MGAQTTVQIQARPCDTATAEKTGMVHFIRSGEGAFTALSEGDLRVTCGGAAVTLRLRPVAALRISETSPAWLNRERRTLEVHGFDKDGHELRLGDAVVWSSSDNLTKQSRCSDMSGFCLAAWQQPLRPTLAGPAWVRVSAVGKSAQSKFEVR